MKNLSAITRKLDLPTVGIFAFALASTWSLYQFVNNHAIHQTWLYWIPAALVEIVTAWLTKHAVEAVYQVTRSNLPKQDKRFFRIVLVSAIALVIPTFVTSILANLYEFNGQIWLALLFPVAVAGCAIGAQIPRSVARYTNAGDDDSKAELRTIRTELKQARAELEQSHTLKRADKTAYAELCAGMNGNVPGTVRAVQDFLNERGFYAVPDSTARNWCTE